MLYINSEQIVLNYMYVHVVSANWFKFELQI